MSDGLLLLAKDGRYDDADLVRTDFRIKRGTRRRAEENDDDPVVITIWLKPLSGAQLRKIFDRSLIEVKKGKKTKHKISAGAFTVDQVALTIAKWEGVLDPENGEPAKVSEENVDRLPGWIINKLQKKASEMNELSEEDEGN